jgi:IMP cyclohydrolase
MDPSLNNLTAMEYPGRVLIIGRAPGDGRAIVIYAITGRSPSSQARMLEWRDNGVWVRPTDEKTLRTGNVDLLVYPAVLHFPGGIAVSNGKQTSDIRIRLEEGKSGPVAVLAAALRTWDYEPDAPNFTPRISGCVLPGPSAALSVIRRDGDGTPLRNYHEVPLVAGKGKLITTYDGINRDPLRSFSGDPVDVGIKSGNPGVLAEAAYAALAPSGQRPDFRVAVTCVAADDIGANRFEIAVINRHERT